MRTRMRTRTDEGDELGRGRHVLSDEQHEDGIGQKDGNSERYLQMPNYQIVCTVYHLFV